MNNSMRHIRPYRIFALIEARPMERVVNVPLPSRRGLGGTSLLEAFLILAGIRVVGARRVFEFGTFLGTNTLNMALNSSDDAKIFTLDLDEQHAVGARQMDADAQLTRMHLTSQSLLDFAGTPAAGKIVTLFGDSTKFDFSSFKGTVDFSFIDGGHDFATVKSDTENALEMAAKETPSAIMWHDYRRLEYPDVTRYLDDLALQRDLFHVEDTTLCVWFNDPKGSILPRLAV